jgi:hypothetical protein
MNSGQSFDYLLYDLQNDPYETTNLYDLPAYAVVQVTNTIYSLRTF